MPRFVQITDDDDHERALERYRELFGSPRESAEGMEFRALSSAIQEYEMQRFPRVFAPTDAADEVEFMLEQGMATLEQLYPIFGGPEPFIEFMTRRRELEDAELDALVVNFNTRREWLDKPSCKPEGWDDIAKWEHVPWRQELLRYMPVPAGAD